MKRKSSRSEVAKILENFVDNLGDDFDWDNFLSMGSFEDPQLEKIRLRCDGLQDEFPASEAGQYTGPEGIRVIRDYIRELRGEP